ncbi:MAG: metallophosphoesterase family protein [Bacteroidetes bacterium]|nr:metallophosphoesterase family protein [Bacteroidota bacterium]
MKSIGLISDTHSFIHPSIFKHFDDVDEIWHAGDMGNIALADELSKFKPFKAVYGNIDGQEIRKVYPEIDLFNCEKTKVLMMHIGGYPNKYELKAKNLIELNKPKLFISGHSHILKVIYDKKYDLLHINPGAAGKYGFHKVITLLKFKISLDKISDMKIIELEK